MKENENVKKAVVSESMFHRIWREFNSVKCSVCEQPKRLHQSFCSKCYYSLPESMRKNLYKGFGDGYEEAHETATDWLNQERRRLA